MKAKSRIVSLLTAALSAVLALVLGVATLHIQPKTVSATEAGNYVKVTEAPTDWSGQYLIVYEDGKVAFNGGLTAFDAVSNTISVSISNGTIEANETTNAAKFTVAKSSTGYSIQGTSGKYVGHGSNANGLTTGDTALVNTLSLNSDSTVNIIGSGGAYLRYNFASNQLRFRYYKSSSYAGQKAICLYKYEEAVTCEHANTSCDPIGDGTHNVVCGDCGATIRTEDCSYIDGVCECGYNEKTPQLSIAISENENAYTCVGGETITVVVEKAENLTEEISWSSSSTSVATVDNGVVTAVGMGKATITAEADGLSDTVEVMIYPEANTVISIADALTVCEWTGASNAPYTYSTTGTIESIDTPYNSQYGNITVTITDGTDSIKAFRMSGGEELAVGMKITVTGTLVNFGGNTPEFIAGCTYVKETDEEFDRILEELNAVEATMSLAYKYTQETVKREIASVVEVTDTLNRATTGITGTTYTEWSGKTASSSAVYAGQSAGGNDSIQLRSSNSNSGIVTTTSGGKATKVTVVWNSNTASGRTLDVYGYDKAYTSPTELYGNNAKGTNIGSIVYGTSTELVITGDYAYIGLRSKSSALYLNSVSITWASESENAGEMEEVVELKDSEFRLRCEVNASLLDITSERITEFGIQVSAGDKVVNYTTTAKTWGVENGKAYVILSLGDIINDTEKLNTVFTVQAYVVVDGFTHVSTTTNEPHSVASMVKHYYETMGLNEVEHLYNHLFGEVA